MLCTKDQVKARVGITGTDDDTRIDELIKQATRVIQMRYGREFIQPTAAATRTFSVKDSCVNLAPYELRAATTVTLHPEATSPLVLTANVDYALLPIGTDPLTGTYLAIKLASGIYLGSDFSSNFGVAQLRIAGTWGAWASVATVADDVQAAAIETVLAWLDRPSSDIAGYETLGESRQPGPPIPQAWDIPASAHRKLLPYTRYIGSY